jgi:hypothetical protein
MFCAPTLKHDTVVFLDDILIMSFSIKEHASHLDAALTALRQHNLFCQLPK